MGVSCVIAKGLPSPRLGHRPHDPTFRPEITSLCSSRPSDLWCFKDACPIYDAAHEEPRRLSRDRALLLGDRRDLRKGAPVSPGRQLGDPAGRRHLGEVPGMAIDARGKIFAFHRSDPPIVELDASGKILKMWGEKLFAWPHGIRVDRTGNLWITDGQARNGIGQQVFKYSPDGTLLMTLGTKGVRGKAPTPSAGRAMSRSPTTATSSSPTAINSRVVKFDKDGKFIKAWGKRGTGPGEFNLPHTLVIDSRGRVLVGDRSNNRIQIFDQDGTFIDQWTQFGTPSGMYITPDDTLYVVDYNVKKGVFVGSAKDGSVKYKLDEAVAEGVAVDRDGNIYVGETIPGRR